MNVHALKGQLNIAKGRASLRATPFANEKKEKETVIKLIVFEVESVEVESVEVESVEVESFKVESLVVESDLNFLNNFEPFLPNTGNKIFKLLNVKSLNKHITT